LILARLEGLLKFGRELPWRKHLLIDVSSSLLGKFLTHMFDTCKSTIEHILQILRQEITIAFMLVSATAFVQRGGAFCLVKFEM